MLLPTRTIRVTVATAAAALAVTVALTGCGGSDDSSTKATSSSTSIAAAPSSISATPSGDNAAAPTADSLKATLIEFADPALSTDEKAKLIVNGDARKSNIDQMNGMLAGYTLTFAVDNVVTSGNTATADVTITSPHGTAPAFPVTWEQVDGTWKLSDASGCLLLGFAQAPCTPA
ncbi:hypothetical protein [Nocardia sp. MW-W600-9]